MKLIMTLLVRDAESILPGNIAFHLGQGVDYFIITDNLSCDATPAIIDGYVRRGLAEAIHEPDDDYSQARWVTRMARRAAELGADWVINADDDEFWFSADGSLPDVLAAQPEDCAAVAVERRNHPPVAGGEGRRFVETMRYREWRSFNAVGQPLPPKVCHRAFADIAVGQGNHEVFRDGVELVAAPCPALAIAHYPVRDYASFENKIVKGGAAYARNTHLDPGAGGTWRHLHRLWQAGELRDWFDRQVLSPERIAAGLAKGALVEDLTVADALRGTSL